MNCKVGTIATKEGATSEIDGCEQCDIGNYSPGGNNIKCSKQDCPVGHIVTKKGAKDATEGCEPCEPNTWSIGGISSQCALQQCPEGQYIIANEFKAAY